MARHRVLELSFIDNHLRHAGDIIDYDGKADRNLELVKEPKRRVAQAQDEEPEDETLA